MGSVYRTPGRSIWMMQYYRNGIRIPEEQRVDEQDESAAAL